MQLRESLMESKAKALDANMGDILHTLNRTNQEINSICLVSAKINALINYGQETKI